MVIYLQLTSARGPQECAYAVGKVFNEIQKEFPKCEVIEQVETSIKGDFHSITFQLELKESELSYFKQEWIGTILWVEKSPYRKNHKRKNWFVGLFEIVLPKASELQLDDVVISTTRSQGSGGQNVNKVESAVIIKHLPTGITIKAQSERSQHMNKQRAFELLKAALEKKNTITKLQIQFENWMQHNQLERGNPVKVFKSQNI